MTGYCSTILAADSTALQGWDYIVLLLYMVGLLGAGLYLARGQKSSEDYFVGGRTMPWFAIGLSLIASLLSTITFLGYPGETIRYGLAKAASNWAIPLAFVVICFAWLPFFMALRLTSVYEYLERRFGQAARWVGLSLFVFILRLGWMAVIVVTVSKAVGHITYEDALAAFDQHLGWNLSFETWVLLLVLLSGILATVYTMLGGIKAVVWTDVAQFFILFTGALLTLIVVASRTGTGPADWYHTLTTVAHKPMTLASWDLSERTTLLWITLYAFFWLVCTYCGDQVAMQRYFSLSTTRQAVLASITYCLGQLAMVTLLALCGMALLTYYTQFPQDIIAGITNPQDPMAADSVFPHFIAHGLPPGLSGLVVAALFAVAMSSLDSGLNSVSTVLTVDVFRKLKPDMTGRAELKLARILTLLIGVAVMALSIVLMRLPRDWNIIDTCTRTFDCALGPLAGMFIVGMFLPHVGQRAIIISALTGVVLAFIIAWWTELGWVLGLVDAENFDAALKTVRRPSSFLALPVSLLFTFLLASILGAFLPPPDPHKTRSLTWRAVVFGK